MNIESKSFINELLKLAYSLPKGKVKKATITKLADLEPDKNGNMVYKSKDTDQANKTVGDNHKSPRSPYESYTEDSLYGYNIKTSSLLKEAIISQFKGPRAFNANIDSEPDADLDERDANTEEEQKVAAFKPSKLLRNEGFPMPKLNIKSTISPIHRNMSTIGYRGTTAKGPNKLTKIGMVMKGRKYPSEEMKKEYDAAYDGPKEDFEAPDVPVLQYPREHIGIFK